MTVRTRSAVVLRPRPGPGLGAGVRGLLLALIAWLTLTVALMPSLMPSMWALDAGAAPPAAAVAPVAHHGHSGHSTHPAQHASPADSDTAHTGHTGHSASGPQHCPWCHLNHHLALPVTALLVLPWAACARLAGPVLATLRLPATPPRLRPPAQGPPV